MPRADRNVPCHKNEPDEKKLIVRRLSAYKGLTKPGHFFHIQAFMIARPRSSYCRRVLVIFSEQAGKEFLHA